MRHLIEWFLKPQVYCRADYFLIILASVAFSNAFSCWLLLIR